jgi:hypothetical protein
MKAKGGLSPEARGFKTGYGSKEPGSNAAAQGAQLKRVGQKLDSIGPCGGHTAVKTYQPKGGKRY